MNPEKPMDPMVNYQEFVADVAVALSQSVSDYVALSTRFTSHDRSDQEFAEVTQAARSAARELARMARIGQELSLRNPSESETSSLAELVPLLYAITGSLTLVALSDDWNGLDGEPLLTGDTLDILLDDSTVALLKTVKD